MPNSYRLLSLVVLLAFAASLGTALWNSNSDADSSAELSLLPVAYAEPVDVTTSDTLRAGETLSELLDRAQLASAEAQALLDEMALHQDPRRMQPGSVVAFHRSVDNGTLRGMDLRLDADRTLSMQRVGNQWAGEVRQVPVHADTVVLTGVVETSLYGALLDGDGEGVPAAEREQIADMLADRIFAWQVDFSRDLRTGDVYRILYEREVRPDGTARSGHVLSAQFNINDRDYEAYAFTPGDASEGYFDRDGNSLRRAFLRAPLQFRRISSAFSYGRFHPILNRTRPHEGIDYAADIGTPVRAVGDGVISRASGGGDYGNVIQIDHPRGYSTLYAHLNRFADGIRRGRRVKQGEVIGYVGQTGLATGPHLHYEFHEDGVPVDPNSIEEIPGDPIPSEYQNQFARTMRMQIASLNQFSSTILLADGATRPARHTGD